jgi:hypothetical protein
MFRKLGTALVLFLALSTAAEPRAFPRGNYLSPTTGFNGGKAQMNTGDVAYGGGYEFVNEALNMQAWSACDNSGAVPANELDSNGYPLPASNVMTARSGVCSIYFAPNPNDAGYVRAVQTTGKCDLRLNGTIVTTATQPTPITVSSITGSTTTTTINFSGAHMFTAGMEVIPSGVTGTIAASLNGNVFVVASIGTNTITITTAGLNGLSGSGGNIAYGRMQIGVATGGRYIFAWPNPPPTGTDGGQIRATISMFSTDAVSPCTRIAVVQVGSEETRYNADPLAFSQKHLDVLATSKPGVVRNLNLVHGNYSNEVLWADRKPTTYYSYVAGHAVPSIYQATATGSGHDYTASAGTGTPPDKMQITTTFPSIAVTCSVGASAELTFAATPPGVNDAFRVFSTFGSGALPTNSATSQPMVTYNKQYFVKTVVGNKITFSETLAGTDYVFSSCGAATLQAHITEADTPATFTAATTTVTWTNHPPLSVGDPVICAKADGTGVLPTNYDEWKLSYYVQSVPTGNTMTLAATSGGAAITWTGSPSGNLKCSRQPTFKLSGGSAYPLRDVGFGAVSFGGNSQPLAKCFGNGFCQGTLTFDAGIGAWALYGANDASGDIMIANNWPPEVFLRYAIAAAGHGWVVSPQYTLDPVSDYMPSLIKMWKDGAPSWMIPRFEGINECWNGSFAPTGYTIYKSKANWPSSTVNGYNVNAECGKMFSTLGQVAQQVYGGGTVGNGYHMVAGVQTGLANNVVNAGNAYGERQNTTLYSGQTPGTQQANLTGAWGTITFSLNPAYNYVTAIAQANYFNPATYNTTQEATWAASVRIFNGSVTGTTMTVTSMAVGTRPLAAGDWLYGGFLNQNPTIVAQLTGTGGAPCPHVTCDGTTGTYSITQNLGTLQTNPQRMAAVDQATAAAYAATFNGLNATCTLAAGVLTVAGIDYPLLQEIRNVAGIPTVMGSGIDYGTLILSNGTGTGGNGTYNVSGTQSVGPVACTMGVFTVPANQNLSYSIYTWAQTFTNLAGAHPALFGYEGGYSPDYTNSAGEQINRLRFFGKLPSNMYTLSVQNQQSFIAVGGTFPSQFNFTGPQPSSLVWSILEDIYQDPNTPLFRAFKDCSTGAVC